MVEWGGVVGMEGRGRGRGGEGMWRGPRVGGEREELMVELDIQPGLIN